MVKKIRILSTVRKGLINKRKTPSKNSWRCLTCGHINPANVVRCQNYVGHQEKIRSKKFD